MTTKLPIRRGPRALLMTLGFGMSMQGMAQADPPPETGSSPAAAAPPASAAPAAPQQNFFSSLKQAFKQDFDNDVVRGHFDVGTPPDTHRYYCLVDTKTGKRQPSGVAGEPVTRPDRMTGIKAAAVSLYTCDSAEQQGILVTSGYVLSGAAARVPSPPPIPTASTAVASAPPAPQPFVAANPPRTGPGIVDVAGLRIGMSVDEVRNVLKTKNLADSYESHGTLGAVASGSVTQGTGGRFVNVIAAWTPTSAAVDGPGGGANGEVAAAESYEILFTPVPANERAMAIKHSVGYSAADAPRESSLNTGLLKKYGGFPQANELTDSVTWRVQSDGSVQVGDTCNRRSVVGGLSPVIPVLRPRPNLALNATLEEFRFQIEHCGITLITEDHANIGSNAGRGDAAVSRFTVTAYSPSLALEGATAAAQWNQRSRETAAKTTAERPMGPSTPDL